MSVCEQAGVLDGGAGLGLGLHAGVLLSGSQHFTCCVTIPGTHLCLHLCVPARADLLCPEQGSPVLLFHLPPPKLLMFPCQLHGKGVG